MITSNIYKALFWKRQDRKRTNWEMKFHIIIRNILNKQFRDLAATIREDNMNAMHIEMNKEPIEKMFIDLYRTVGVSFAKDSFNELKADGRTVLVKEEDMTDEWTKYMINYAKLRAGKRIISIAESSKEQALKIIRAVLDLSASEGWGSVETATAIRKGLVDKGIEINQWRSLRIARTEVITASNTGSFIGAKATGATEKYWIATRDNRVRPEHLAAEAQNPKGIDEPFLIGGIPMECPGDPDGLAEDVINCRCAIAFG
jgi:hypothetical protein